ncbi:MAG: hypothetical protein SFT81_06720 [Candidatus Caenarcaniphilales bacterium]|nr:hypothetical protein [Candidatus Caenarcaniphilales bacterium]
MTRFFRQTKNNQIRFISFDETNKPCNFIEGAGSIPLEAARALAEKSFSLPAAGFSTSTATSTAPIISGSGLLGAAIPGTAIGLLFASTLDGLVLDRDQDGVVDPWIPGAGGGSTFTRFIADKYVELENRVNAATSNRSSTTLSSTPTTDPSTSQTIKVVEDSDLWDLKFSKTPQTKSNDSPSQPSPPTSPLPPNPPGGGGSNGGNNSGGNNGGNQPPQSNNNSFWRLLPHFLVSAVSSLVGFNIRNPEVEDLRNENKVLQNQLSQSTASPTPTATASPTPTSSPTAVPPLIDF